MTDAINQIREALEAVVKTYGVADKWNPTELLRLSGKALKALDRLTLPQGVWVPQSALDWLFGEGQDANGQWFHDSHAAEHGYIGRFEKKFWWRTHFRKLIAAAPKPEAIIPVQDAERESFEGIPDADVGSRTAGAHPATGAKPDLASMLERVPEGKEMHVHFIPAYEDEGLMVPESWSVQFRTPANYGSFPFAAAIGMSFESALAAALEKVK